MKLFKIIGLVFCGILISVGCVQAKDFTLAQVTQIQKIIHDYIVKNPQVLVEASRALQQQQAAAARKQTGAAIEANKASLFNFSGMPFAGNSKAHIVMLEYFDYRCPHCQLMIPAIEQLIKNNSHLKVVFADWPIFGGSSVYAAQVALASMQQGKYYQFHNAMLQKAEQLEMNRQPVTNKDILGVAKSVGLDINKLQAGLKDANIKAILGRNDTNARAIKIVGTPAFIVVNTKTNKSEYLDGQTTAAALQVLIDAVK